jgi:hypothetical protein
MQRLRAHRPATYPECYTAQGIVVFKQHAPTTTLESMRSEMNRCDAVVVLVRFENQSIGHWVCLGFDSTGFPKAADGAVLEWGPLPSWRIDTTVGFMSATGIGRP